MNDTPKVSTPKPDTNTWLALERNYLADERTLLAWMRTGLSMISFGFTLGKLGQVLENVHFKGVFGVTRTLSMKELACFLVILGTLALPTASYQHWRRLRVLRGMGYTVHVDLAFMTAMFLTVVGVFAFASLLISI
jgi:putative membrane protein